MKKLMKKILMAAMLAIVGWTGASYADTYPSKPIRIVVPWAPGTPADLAARSISDRLGAALGQPVLVDNKPGASGLVGLADALRQPADGYTLYILDTSTLLAPVLYPMQQIDIAKNLTGIAPIGFYDNVLVTGTSTPYGHVRDFVATAKTRKDPVSFASGGKGTPAHIAGEQFRESTKVPMTHVPYNQISMAISDLISGRVDFMFLTASVAVAQITGGKLRGIATTARMRLPQLPGVPTMIEEGYPDFQMRQGFDMLAAKSGTPKEVLERLNAEVNVALSAPEVKERLRLIAFELRPLSLTDAGELVGSEQSALLRLAQAISLKAE